ncbi:hypothetical protein GCM10009133_21540 [Cocleimonas flava]|jgi:MoxR-like ATPase|uniref:Dynein-related subfamily AAA family protein n=1 Tax=Cocleimonas flava TaxID=634765 RepID=A0A4R1EQI2_9GAMM|nr:AAA family ATPase [Cocleimonas flava]TCJ82690.1 dynein-related subfamily AAA family protein [Cocleimonas flava]
MSDSQYTYKYYGAFCNTDAISSFVNHQLNIHFNEDLNVKTPLCIWGRHGIGKTQLVEQIAEENGYDFAYVAPAQFEEMGDLLGMPYLDKETNSTKFAPPEWVPTTEGPGILLIDDVNRADDRILRGIMQLLQNYELSAWKLPSKWHIILTANPEGGDYSITTMDDAMLTRMMHVSMEFDVKNWASWALKNGVDERGVNFVLTYPELVTGELTTPRSLVQFFESIKNIDDLKENLLLVNTLALSSLDKNTASAFTAFVSNNLDKLIAPKEILESRKFEQTIAPKIETLVNQQVKRIDILSTIGIRLVNYVAQNELNTSEVENLKKFLKLSLIPEDLRLILVQEIAKDKRSEIKKLFSDPVLAMLILTV